jgi:hypothetical protein
MLKSSQRRRNAFYRKALITAQKCNLRFDDTIALYHRMADSKRIDRLSRRYGTATLWDKAERGMEGVCMISVPILLHVKQEIIGWRTFSNEHDFEHAQTPT